MNNLIIIMLLVFLSGCTLEGEVYPWYDDRGNIGIINSIKF